VFLLLVRFLSDKVKEKTIKELLERTSELEELDLIEDEEDSSSMAKQYVEQARKKAKRFKQRK